MTACCEAVVEGNLLKKKNQRRGSWECGLAGSLSGMPKALGWMLSSA